uniref:PH domain-containing protein n=1 Tax=Anopheles quadriannulatus TaxID=34691 RepID=A0A182XND4_ANOQN
MLVPNSTRKSLLIGRIPVAQMTGPIKRGLLWQQRDRLFSRWKERYFILTRDYLNCFKRATGSASEKISDMGQFIFKVSF